MHAWDNPTDPERRPPDAPDTPDEPDTPEDRPPVERDPEAQRAPGAGQEDPDAGGPPMQAGG